MQARVRTRLFVRIGDGTEYLQLLTVVGITTVLVVRGMLALLGYPQVGGGTLHIAHVLWGGLSMLTGLIASMLFVGRGARFYAAVFGGIGLGLFIDEVGKFVTQTNDYFYRPAAAIIYLVFVLLVTITSLIDRDKLTDVPERIVNASSIATVGLASGLTPHDRAEAKMILEGRDDLQSNALRALLEATPDRSHSMIYQKLVQRPLEHIENIASRPWFATLVFTIFTMQTLAVFGHYVFRSIEVANGSITEANAFAGSTYGATITIGISALLAITGCVAIFIKRNVGLEMLRLAVLTDLLISQVFTFNETQFRAILTLPFALAALGVIGYERHRRRTKIS